MSLAQSNLAQPSDHERTSTPGASGLGSKMWLAVTLAAILALAALDTTGGNSAATGSEAGQAPILDGRGKWSGYMP